MLTDDCLIIEKNHIGGVQRIYKFGNYGLSLINSPKVHLYSFAWEAAILSGVKSDGTFEGIDYSTPLSQDVEIFDSDEEANEFIMKAKEYFTKMDIKE